MDLKNPTATVFTNLVGIASTRLTALMVVATNRAASSHQACETQISLVAVCCFVVFIECANHFYPDWIVSFIGCNFWCFCWPSYCLFVDVHNGLFWYPCFTLVFPFCPIHCSGMASQEKAKEVKTGSELRDLQNEAEAAAAG